MDLEYEKKLKSNLKVIRYYIGMENLKKSERNMIENIVYCMEDFKY
jgi:hypothetical protein